MKPQIVWSLIGDFPITFKFGEAPKWYTDVFGFPHNGIDIGCPCGTPVLACDSGVVTFADDIPDSDGMGLILKHDWGISLYWHLSQISAKTGFWPEKGAAIGLSGATGFATGPHLHFGIKVLGDAPAGMRDWSDPEKYLVSGAPEVSLPKPKDVLYIVSSGETLWSISQKFYGSGFYWTKIYNANKAQIKNPNEIFPGQEFLIP